jgi:hypothetical protein
MCAFRESVSREILLQVNHGRAVQFKLYWIDEVFFVAGATLSAPDLNYIIQLLPGEYDDQSQSQPPRLHAALTDPSSTLSPSPGFQISSSTLTLPFTIALLSGVASYALPFYSGHSSFMSIPPTPNNSTYSLAAGSLIVSSNTLVVLRSGSKHLVLSESIPDFGQLPSTISNPISAISIQSSACSSPCSGSGVCASSGTCSCLGGFSGTLCEACMPGHYGPSCSPCPQGCATCDDGIGETGQCLNANTSTPQGGCHCLHGVCNNQTGECTCLPGWENPGDNTTAACSVCSPGFYVDQDGNCRSALPPWSSFYMSDF